MAANNTIDIGIRDWSINPSLQVANTIIQSILRSQADRVAITLLSTSSESIDSTKRDLAKITPRPGDFALLHAGRSWKGQSIGA